MKTPDKYKAKKRQYEDKSWLYQQYWGELKPVREIADICGVNHYTIRRQMVSYGIPRRCDAYQRSNSVSPFSGFYNGEIARTDRESTQQYDPEYQDETEFAWEFEDYQ